MPPQDTTPQIQPVAPTPSSAAITTAPNVMTAPPAASVQGSGNHVMGKLLLALAFLVLGLGAGAGGGYFMGKIDGNAEGMAQAQADYEMQQMAAQQAEQAAVIETYSDIQTNPLDTVQTNPFE